VTTTQILVASLPVADIDSAELAIPERTARLEIPRSLCDRVRAVLREVITDVAQPASAYSPSILVGAMISPSTRSSADDQRLSPPTTSPIGALRLPRQGNRWCLQAARVAQCKNEVESTDYHGSE